MAEERLQKVIAAAGIASRRHAEELILAGRVTVNGDVVRELGTRVDSEHDRIEVDGKPLSPEGHLYLALNKPVGVVTTADDPQGRTTVIDLLPPDIGRVYPVGRLDLDTRGLVLLTNDGQVAHRLMHPRYEHEKEYHVRVAGQPSESILDTLRQGIELDDGVTAPAEIDIIRRGRDNTLLRIILHEGRKRQIRRMFDAIEHPVRDLIRVRIGPIEMGELPEGEWRRLTPRETGALRRLAGADEKRPSAKRAQGSAGKRAPSQGGPATGGKKEPGVRGAGADRPPRPSARPAGSRVGPSAARPSKSSRSGRDTGQGPRDDWDMDIHPPRSGERPPARGASRSGKRDTDDRPPRSGPRPPARGASRPGERDTTDRPPRSASRPPARGASRSGERDTDDRPPRSGPRPPARGASRPGERDTGDRPPRSASRPPARGTSRPGERDTTDRPPRSASRPPARGASRPGERDTTDRPPRSASRPPARGTSRPGERDTTDRPPRSGARPPARGASRGSASSRPTAGRKPSGGRPPSKGSRRRG